jgi:hypothetical protein
VRTSSPALVARLLLLALVTLASRASAQQQTGNLTFEVTDSSGKPIAGVNITIASSKTPSQLRETDARGKARFLLMPPGTYTADVMADGYTSMRRDVAVPLGGDVVERLTLATGELSETVEITAHPEVDVTQTSTTQVYTGEALQQLQIASANRSYLGALGHSPGVAGGSGDPIVHGATRGENVYVIDGVNTTDPVTGTFGLLTNFDTIDQVEFTTGGFQAEYGGGTGGYVNQITKSGTNEWDGALDLRYYDDSFIQDTEYFPGDQSQKFKLGSFTIGGPIKRDKAWFLASYEKDITSFTANGTPVTREFDGSARLLKFTFQPHANHRLDLQYSADPATITNDNISRLVKPEAGNFQEQGAKFFKLTYWGRLSDEWALSAQAGRYESKLNTFPLHDSGRPSIIEDAFTNTLFNNYDDAQFSKRLNRQVSMSAERAWSAARGDHDLKFGFDVQRTQLDALREEPGGEAWHSVGLDPVTGDPRDDGIVLWDDGNGDGIPDNVYEIDRLTSVGTVTNTGRNTSLFVQDTWRRGKMTLDYGLRWDRATADRDDKEQVVDVALLQPRMGVSVDLRGDQKQRMYSTLTRRMHPGILAVPSIVNMRNNVTDVYYNEAWVGADCDGSGSIDFELVYCGSQGGPSSSKVDPRLKATYLDELIYGYQWQFAPKQDFGARLVVNRTHDIIEDTLDDPTLGTYLITNLHGLKRRYEGVELEYAWHHKRGLLAANWTMARARGNVEYTQGTGSDFDYLPVHAVNRYGYLSTDRRHRVKVYGWVDLPKRWSVAYDVFYRSGAPYERVKNLSGPDPVTGLPLYGVEYLDSRGSHRLPSLFTVDASVKKYFAFGEKAGMRLALIGAVTNLLGENSVTARQTLDNDGSHGESAASHWGEPTAYLDPRSYELGLRFEF